MKLKLLKALTGTPHKAGDLIDVASNIGEKLIARGVAEGAFQRAPPPPPKAEVPRGKRWKGGKS